MRRRRRSRRRDPNSAAGRALDEAINALDGHRESLDVAKRVRDGNIEGARESLRRYKAPLTKALDGGRKRLEDEMRSLAHFDAPLDAAKKQGRRRRSGPGSSKAM